MRFKKPGTASFDGSANVTLSVTVSSIGTADVGAATTPIYLKAGAPVAGTPLAKVAISGAYADLSGGPDLSPYATTATLNAYKASNDKAVAAKLTQSDLETALSELITEFGGTVPTD